MKPSAVLGYIMADMVWRLNNLFKMLQPFFLVTYVSWYNIMQFKVMMYDYLTVKLSTCDLKMKQS